MEFVNNVDMVMVFMTGVVFFCGWWRVTLIPLAQLSFVGGGIW